MKRDTDYGTGILDVFLFVLMAVSLERQQRRDYYTKEEGKGAVTVRKLPSDSLKAKIIELLEEKDIR